MASQCRMHVRLRHVYSIIIGSKKLLMSNSTIVHGYIQGALVLVRFVRVDRPLRISSKEPSRRADLLE